MSDGLSPLLFTTPPQGAPQGGNAAAEPPAAAAGGEVLTALFAPLLAQLRPAPEATSPPLAPALAGSVEPLAGAAAQREDELIFWMLGLPASAPAMPLTPNVGPPASAQPAASALAPERAPPAPLWSVATRGESGAPASPSPTLIAEEGTLLADDTLAKSSPQGGAPPPLFASSSHGEGTPRSESSGWSVANPAPFNPLGPTQQGTGTLAAPSAPVTSAAVGAELAALDLADPQWQEQLTGRLNQMIQFQLRSATIQIDPPEWGALEIQLQLNRQQVDITFSAAEAHLREALEAALPRLRERFEQQALTLGEATIADANTQAHSQGQAQGGDGHPTRHDQGAGDAQGSDDLAAPVHTATTFRRGLVDRYV